MKKPISVFCFLLLVCTRISSDEESTPTTGVPSGQRSFYGQSPQSLPPLAPFTCKVKIYEKTMHKGDFLYSWKNVNSLYECVGYCHQYSSAFGVCKAINYFTNMKSCDLLSGPSEHPEMESVPASFDWVNIKHAEIVWCNGNAWSVKPTTPSPAFHYKDCGEQFYQPKLDVSVHHRIVNGVEAIPHSWPWTVSILYYGEHMCGGTLIPVAPHLNQTDMVLTAAHCVKDQHIGEVNVSHLAVLAGSHSRISLHGDEQKEHVESVHWFPYYMTDNRMNDIALIKLKTPIKFTPKILPICLPKQREPVRLDSKCFTTGWGRYKDDEDEHDMADTLQQLHVPIVDSDTCKRESVWGNRVNSVIMVCAGSLDGNQNVCTGDSGGALMCLEDDHWVQHGVVSFVYRQDCTARNKPAVYTRVSMYRAWIDRMIQMHSTIYARNIGEG